VAASVKVSRKPATSKDKTYTVEYHWLEGQYSRLPAVIADVIRRPVAVIAHTWQASLQHALPRRRRRRLQSCSRYGMTGPSWIGGRLGRRAATYRRDPR